MENTEFIRNIYTNVTNEIHNNYYVAFPEWWIGWSNLMWYVNIKSSMINLIFLYERVFI
jgi:hypothetical protein